MTWSCPAIDNGVVIYDDNKIRPCALIDWQYSKPMSEITNPNRFKDLYNSATPPQVCNNCNQVEQQKLNSYRMYYLRQVKHSPPTTNIRFVDIRNTNFCNAKCRFCGPYHSNLWDLEINNVSKPRKSDFTEYLALLDNPDLIEVYFAGGEPLVSDDHYMFLQKMIDNGTSRNVKLRYSSNLSTLNYKNKDIFDYWKKFKHVLVDASADGIREIYNNIRSNLKWETFKTNLNTLIENNVTVKVFFVLNNLNVWFLKDSLDFFKNNNIEYNVHLITGPDYFMLREIPSELKEKAIKQVLECQDLLSVTEQQYYITEIQKTGQGLWQGQITNQRKLDNIRNETMIPILINAGVLNDAK